MTLNFHMILSYFLFYDLELCMGDWASKVVWFAL
ncbi:hypothetical protein GLYMA_11G186601v4 [Glycine max]|nr:hypothetical protein GLYMA_11G186601v4 [Glycine max]KAH1159930.1 hypothetical protein GYH30_031621 [Glycine max]